MNVYLVTLTYSDHEGDYVTPLHIASSRAKAQRWIDKQPSPDRMSAYDTIRFRIDQDQPR